MLMNEIQPVVIYITDERKSHMEKELKSLPFDPLYYKGYTPNDCTSYINYKHQEYPEKDTTLCCTKSHIGALKYYLENSTKSMVLILEDDVLFTKNFMSKVQHILELWQKHESEIDFVSIGYAVNTQIKSNKSDCELYWDLYCKDGCVWGALGYLVKRAVAEDIVRCFDQPTTLELNQAIQKKIKDNGNKIYSPKVIRAQIDAILSLCWRQAFVKPILIIESPLFNSTIMPDDSNSNTRGWNAAFKSGELNIDEFDECCKLYLE
jgi:GR25 family glycosyltransferase involved in LPS biosynthesis